MINREGLTVALGMFAALAALVGVLMLGTYLLTETDNLFLRIIGGILIASPFVSIFVAVAIEASGNGN